MARNISDKIISNTIFNLAGNFWKTLVGLALTPYIVGHVGLDGFGVWAIVSVVTGYFGLLDFGIGASFVKYLSQFYAKGEYDRINQLVNTGIVFYSLFTVLISILAYFALDPLIGLLAIPAELYDVAYFVFFVGVVLFGLTSIFSVFSAIQGGLQRMDLTNKVSVAVSIPMLLGTVYFLEAGYGLPGLIINSVIVFFITGAINLFIASRLIPELRINPLLFSREMFGKIFNFGYKVQIGNISDVVAFQTDKLIISHFLGPAFVGTYQLGSSMAQTMRSLPILLISSILPAASEIHTLEDHAKLRELYTRGTKYLMLASFPIAAFVIVSAGPIMLAWMGPGHEAAVFIVQILAVGYLFNLMSGIAVSVGSAIDKPEYLMNAALVTIVSNVLLCLALVYIAGMPGVAIGNAISLVIGSGYYFYRFHGEIKLPLSDFLKKTALLPLVASAIPAIPVYLLYYGFSMMNLGTGRVVNFAALALGGLLFMAIYLLIILKGMGLDEYDMGLVRRYLSPGNLMSLIRVREIK